jgi:hypothetical protein
MTGTPRQRRVGMNKKGEGIDRYIYRVCMLGDMKFNYCSISEELIT